MKKLTNWQLADITIGKRDSTLRVRARRSLRSHLAVEYRFRSVSPPIN